MLKSFDGLCGLVSNRLGQDPVSGDLFISINKPRNRIKMFRRKPAGTRTPNLLIRSQNRW